MYRTVLTVVITMVIYCNMVDGHWPFKKVRKLGKKVTVLENEVASLKKDVTMLKGFLKGCTCNSPQGTNTTAIEGTNTTVIKNETKPAEPDFKHWDLHIPIRVNKVNRSSIIYGNFNYTVHFQLYPAGRNLTNFRAFWTQDENNYMFEHLYKNDSIIWPNGTELTSSTVVKSDTNSWVLFVIGWEQVWYVLRMKNSKGGHASERDVKLPELFTNSTDVVYKSGHNVTLEIGITEDVYYCRDECPPPTTKTFITKTFLSSDPIQSLHRLQFLGDVKDQLGSGNITSKRTPSNSTRPGTADKIKTTDTRKPVHGIVVVKSVHNFNNSAVLQNAEIYRHIVMRPANESGPFGKDFFKLVSPRGDRQNCNMFGWCRFPCVAVGSNVTKLSYKIPHSKNSTSYQTFRNSRVTVSSPYQITAATYSPRNKDLDKADEFVCEATNNRNKTITRRVFIDWVWPAKMESMNVKISGSSTYTKELKTRCQAKGVPLPAMTILVECVAGILVFSGNELETKYANRKTHRIHVAKDVTIPYEYAFHPINVTCIAENSSGRDERRRENIVIRF